jgi:hypothetical protein
MLTACGQAQPSPSTNVTSATAAPCVIRNSCTYQNVPGYQCLGTLWNSETGNGASLPASFYQGATCVITYEDWQTTPGCDVNNPNQMCGGGWAGNAPSPCCQAIQGPGPASVTS